VELAVNVVVVVVHEEQAAATAELAQRVAFNIAEPHRQVPGEKHQRILEEIARAEWDDDSGGRDVDLRVARDRINDVRRHHGALSQSPESYCAVAK
jgi:hypothetical protein